MPWEYSVLVVANVTAASDELLEALRARAEADPTRFTLLVPATGGGRGGREAAKERLARALERMQQAGLKAEGSVGDSDPVAAVHDAWDPKKYDEIFVSTLGTGASKWLQVDTPRRIERMTGVSVTHVVAEEPRPQQPGTPPPEHDRWGVLSPLQPLAWSGESEREGGP
jgi:GABA permease